MIKGSLFGFLLLFNLYLFGQEYQFRNLTTEHGLPSNEVYSITSDKEGYLWFCTDKGVSKYDGKNFKTFTMANGLKSSVVFRLNEDSLGRLWTVSFGNAIQYIFRDSVIHYPYKITSTTWDTNRAVTGAQMNLKHTGLLMDDGNKGYYVFNEGKKGFFKDMIELDNTESRRLSQSKNGFQRVYYLNLEGSNYPMFKMISTKSFTSSYSISKIENGYFMLKVPLLYNVNSAAEGRLNFQFINFGDNQYLGLCEDGYYVIFSPNGIIESGRIGLGYPIRCMYENEQGDWIIGSENGAYLYENGDIKVNPKCLIPEVFITSITQDYEGGYWFSTLNKGVFYLPSMGMMTKFGNHKIMSTKRVENSLYFSTSSGEIFKLGDNYNVTRLWLDQRKAYDRYPFEVLENEDLFIPGGSVLRNQNIIAKNLELEKNYTSFKIITKTQMGILAGGSHGIWEFSQKGQFLGNRKLFLEEYNKEAHTRDSKFFGSVFYQRVNSILVTDSINWVGTESGLFIYKNKKLIRPAGSSKNLSSRIDNICLLSGDYLVVGSASTGVIILRTIGDSIVSAHVPELNVTNGVSALLVYDDLLCIGTKRGLLLSKVINNGLIGETYIGVQNGLVSNDIYCLDTFQGKLWVGTDKGFSIIKDIKSHFSSEIPKVNILGVRLGVDRTFKATSWSSNFNSLPRDNIEFEFAGVSYANINLLYKYHLKGYEKDTIVTNRSSVHFSKLKPGNYMFEVWVKASGSEWSKSSQKVRFKIDSFFYETWWFKGLIGLSLLGFGAYLIKEYNSRKQKQLKSHLQTVELKQKALAAMMSPHFINNSLSAIQNLVNKGEKELSNNFISKFAVLIRKNMNAVNKGTISLGAEIERLSLYLELEKLRFGDNLSYEIQASDELLELDDMLIPAMLIQPFVENAIWHGILPNKLGKVEIVFKLITKSLLEVQIVDDGVGFGVSSKKEGHTSLSMNIIEQRLNLLADETGLDCGIKIKPGSNGTGTTVNVRMPIH